MVVSIWHPQCCGRHGLGGLSAHSAPSLGTAHTETSPCTLHVANYDGPKHFLDIDSAGFVVSPTLHTCSVRAWLSVRLNTSESLSGEQGGAVLPQPYVLHRWS